MLNRPIKESDAVFACCVDVPGGGRTFHLAQKEVEVYNRDPDAYAAGLLGLTKDEYLEWVSLDGYALCGEQTKAGRPCCGILSAHYNPIEWKNTHRQLACYSHGGGRANV
jgi:hypothetical protein